MGAGLARSGVCAGVLGAWHDPAGGREGLGRVEGLRRIAQGGNEARRGLAADALDGGQELGQLVVLDGVVDPLVEGGKALEERTRELFSELVAAIVRHSATANLPFRAILFAFGAASRR